MKKIFDYWKLKREKNTLEIEYEILEKRLEEKLLKLNASDNVNKALKKKFEEAITTLTKQLVKVTEEKEKLFKENKRLKKGIKNDSKRNDD